MPPPPPDKHWRSLGRQVVSTFSFGSSISINVRTTTIMLIDKKKHGLCDEVEDGMLQEKGHSAVYICVLVGQAWLHGDLTASV